MTLAITHAKVSAIADGGDTSIVQPSDWNAGHTLTGAASVAQGGTGQISLTDHGVLVGAGTAGVTALSAAAAGTLLAGVASSDPAFSATPQLGIAGTTKGTLGFAGNTSGVVTIQPAAAAGTWTWTLPVDDGTANQVLQTDGAGVTSWATVSASPGGATTQVQFNNAGAFGGDSAFTYNTTTKALTIANASDNISDGTLQGSWPTAGGTSRAFKFSLGGAADIFIGAGAIAMHGGVAIGWANGAGNNPLFDPPDAALARNSAGVVEVNNGTAGTYRDLLARALRSNAVTFANVPATPVEGMCVAITDSTTAVWGATITGTGANHVLGYYNGTNWTVMAK